MTNVTTLDRLRADLLAARKAKDAVAVGLLNPLVGEASMIGKDAGNRETTPEEVVRVVKKFLDNLRETLPHVERRAGDVDDGSIARTRREIAILEGLMPAQMDEAALRGAIEGFLATSPGAGLGQVMAHLKAAHAGTYDGKAASAIAKSALAR